MNNKYPTLRQLLNVLPYSQFVVTEVLYINNKYNSFRTAWRTIEDGELDINNLELSEILDLPVIRVTRTTPVCWYIDVRKDVYKEDTDEA